MDRNEGRLSQIEATIVEAAKRVQQRLGDEYQKLLREDPVKAETYWGPKRPRDFKYLERPYGHVKKWRLFLPYLEGPKTMFEIGVGPGYLFSILRGLGVEMSGCDVPEKENPAFYELRKELGIADLVQAHVVRARQPIPIPEGTESVIAFWTVFNVGWGVGDYQWLHDFCRERLTGERLLIWHFNEGTMTDEVRSFYRSIAESPLLHKAPQGNNFYRLKLAELPSS